MDGNECKTKENIHNNKKKAKNYPRKKITYNIYTVGLGPQGVLQISSDGDDRRIFLGLKFSFPGFFWVGKFGKYIFGWLDLSRDFFGYSKQSEDSWYCPRI